MTAATPNQDAGLSVVGGCCSVATPAPTDSGDAPLTATDAPPTVARGGGPRGYSGFSEIGNVPIPRTLLTDGITDMVRIADARMTGTGYGSCVLHVAPESAVGGPPALVQTRDVIELDVSAGVLDLLVEPAEQERRRAAAPHGSRRRRPPIARGRACTLSTCCRPVLAPTWTFWSGTAAAPSRDIALTARTGAAQQQSMTVSCRLARGRSKAPGWDRDG